MQTMTSPFQEEVRSSIEDRHLLRHPFYVAWSKGELSLEQLRQYAGQYMHHVLAEPTYLGAVHSNTPHFASDGKSDLSMRQAILQNLIDEEFGPENHPALEGIDGLRRAPFTASPTRREGSREIAYHACTRRRTSSIPPPSGV